MNNTDFFFIEVLRIFDAFLTRKENYFIKNINYSPLVDDPYEIYYESLTPYKTGIKFTFHRFKAKNISPLSIEVSQSKNRVIDFLKIKYSGYGFDERKHFSIEEFIIKMGMKNYFKIKELNSQTISNVLLESKNLIQKYLLPVLRGEKWVSEVIEDLKELNN